MTLHIDLDPDTEARLKARAAAEGKAVDAIVEEALIAKLSSPLDKATRSSSLSAEERLKYFEAWARKPRKSGDWPIDDSRESIYAGRGE